MAKVCLSLALSSALRNTEGIQKGLVVPKTFAARYQCLFLRHHANYLDSAEPVFWSCGPLVPRILRRDPFLPFLFIFLITKASYAMLC